MSKKITFEVESLSDGSAIAWLAGARVPDAVAFGDSELDAIRRLCSFMTGGGEAVKLSESISLVCKE